MANGKTETLGRFVISDRIAAGGMASVYVANAPVGDRLSDVPLALKVLHDHLAERSDFVRMFYDEGRIASRMAHPAVVKVFEVGEAEGRHYIAMERVEGYNLAQILSAHRRAGKNVGKAAVFSILRQSLGALAYVHAFSDKRGRKMGIVHRDISPQNLLIGRDEKVRITDFGIARGGHRAEHTATGTIKGKLHYMAPEQAAGGRVDARADLYALGAVAFELLTSQPLHGADVTAELQRRAASGAIDFDRQQFKKLPPDMRRWLRTALGTDPQQRFRNAGEMLQAMEKLKSTSRASFKPGTLARLIKLADNDDPNSEPQFLFSEAEMATTSRTHSRKTARARTPQRAMSRAFLGADAVSRTGLEPSRRLDETMGTPRSWETPPPVPASPSKSRVSSQRKGSSGTVRGARSRSSQRARMLPVEHAVEAKPRKRRRRAAKSSTGIDINDEAARVSAVVSLRSKGGDAEQAEAVADDAAKRRATRSRKKSAAATKSANKSEKKPDTKTTDAKKPGTRTRRRTMIKRSEMDEQRGLAMASFAMWSAVALLLFAMLLESWNAQITFPTVDEQTFAAWFTDAPIEVAAEKPQVIRDKANARARSQAGSDREKWSAPLPEVRNDRFLPRDRPLPQPKPAARPERSDQGTTRHD